MDDRLVDSFAPTPSTVRVTLRTGEVESVDNAHILGIWSASLVIEEAVTESDDGLVKHAGELGIHTVNIHVLALDTIDRVEVDAYAEGRSHTRDSLEAPGRLGDDGELDLEG